MMVFIWDNGLSWGEHEIEFIDGEGFDRQDIKKLIEREKKYYPGGKLIAEGNITWFEGVPIPFHRWYGPNELYIFDDIINLHKFKDISLTTLLQLVDAWEKDKDYFNWDDFNEIRKNVIKNKGISLQEAISIADENFKRVEDLLNKEVERDALGYYLESDDE